jgi:pyruvate kinase
MKTVHNRTKIVATLGPASSQKEVLLNMIKAGVDVCRLNFSHGNTEDHQKVIDIIRDINKKYKTNIISAKIDDLKMVITILLNNFNVEIGSQFNLLQNKENFLVKKNVPEWFLQYCKALAKISH